MRVVCAPLHHLSPQLSSRKRGQTEQQRVGLGSQLSLVMNTWETTPTWSTVKILTTNAFVYRGFMRKKHFCDIVE